MLNLPHNYAMFNDEYIVPIGHMQFITPVFSNLYTESGELVRMHTRNEFNTNNITVSDYQINESGFIYLKEHRFNDTRNEKFQLNLIKYKLYTIGSSYELCYQLWDLNADRYKKTNDIKFSWYNAKHPIYFPIKEVNFTSANNRFFDSVISDSVFFSFEDRELALSRIDYESRNRLNELNYKNMNDAQLTIFLSNRLIDRAKTLKKINK